MGYRYKDGVSREFEKIERGLGIEYTYSDLISLRAGYYYDNETGLYHVRYRMHSPVLGSWLRRDPIRLVQPGTLDYLITEPDEDGTTSVGEASGLDAAARYEDGMSLYLFARGNPLRYYDPDGLAVPAAAYASNPIPEAIFGGDAAPAQAPQCRRVIQYASQARLSRLAGDGLQNAGYARAGRLGKAGTPEQRPGTVRTGATG